MKQSISKYVCSTSLLAGAVVFSGLTNAGFAINRDGSRLAAASVTSCTGGGGIASTASTTYTCYDRVNYGSGVTLVGLNNNSDVVGATNSQYGEAGPDSRAVLFPGGSQTMVDLGVAGMATAISDQGVIGGKVFTLVPPNNYQNSKGFIYQNGTISEILSTHVTLKDVYINGINSRGDIVGAFNVDSISGNLCTHSLFVRKQESGNYSNLDIDTPTCSQEGYLASQPFLSDINDHSEIVGGEGQASLIGAPWSFRAIKLNLTELVMRDAFSNLWDLGYLGSTAYAINNQHVVVGSVAQSSPTSYLEIPAVWRNGQLEILSFANAGHGRAMDINNNGEIVGQQFLFPEDWYSHRAFISKDGQMRTMDESLCSGVTDNSHLTAALKINDRGDILAIRELQDPSSWTVSYELLKPRTVTTGGGGGSGGGGNCYPQ